MIIVFGGSFNPPTKAHQSIMVTVKRVYPEAHILLLPVGNDYHKPDLVDIKHRLAMLKLLVEDMPDVTVSDLEEQGEYGGTLASLDALSKTYDDIYFLIGADQLPYFTTWIRYTELLKRYPLIVMTRRNAPDRTLAEALFKHVEHTFHFIDFDVPISSSDIRKEPSMRDQWLTEPVLDYIHENHLYEE